MPVADTTAVALVVVAAAVVVVVARSSPNNRLFRSGAAKLEETRERRKRIPRGLTIRLRKDVSKIVEVRYRSNPRADGSYV